MVKQSLSPWLADFISKEIAQVIDWRKSLNDIIKPDPDSRFDDDGSNFRSAAADTPTHCLVQLIEVLSVKEQPIVIVSDGHTRVKARLSQATVAVLQDEAGDKFTENMTNDVFQPKSLTVISTPFGTPDGFVQLHIGDIEYEHHLRRTEGQPSPVEENDSIRALLDAINKIRCAGLPTTDPPDCEQVQAQGTAFDPPQSTASQRFQRPSKPEPGAAADPVPLRTSPTVTQPSRVRTSSAFQTQRNMSRKQLGPSMDKDGFEVESGLNLDRPVQAASNDAPDTNVSAQPRVNNAPGSLLLGLLAGNPVQRPRETSPTLPRSPVVVYEDPFGTQVGGNGVQDLDTTINTGLRLPSSAASPSAQPPPKQTSTQGSLRTSGRSNVPYGRRQIPSGQRKLLEQKECWLPPIPGYTFPSPNIPVELLTRWNALMSDASKSVQASSVENDAEGAEPDEEPAVESSDSSASDKEFGASQWPSSPPPRAVDLPPDSSFEKVVRATQQDDLEVAPPRALPEKRVPSSTPLRHLLPPKPAGATYPQDHSSWQEVARADESAQIQRPKRSSINRSPLSRSQPSRPNGTRYEQQNRFEEPSPRRIHDRGIALALSDDARSRSSSVHSSRQPHPSRILRDRNDDESPAQSDAQQYQSSRVWKRQPDKTSGSRSAATGGATSISPPSTSRRPTAMSPPTGPRAMNGNSERDRRWYSQAERPSQQSPSQPEHLMTDLAGSSQWPNVPMTGRRASGLPLNSSPRYSGLPPINGTPSRSEAQRPPSSSLVPATQITDNRSRPVEDRHGDGYSPRHVDRYVPSQRALTDQHPDDRYREVRRDHLWHSRRRGWLQERFILSPWGTETFETVFYAYKDCCTDGTSSDQTLTAEKLQHAAEDAFLEGRPLPHEARFMPKNYLKHIGVTQKKAHGWQKKIPKLEKYLRKNGWTAKLPKELLKVEERLLRYERKRAERERLQMDEQRRRPEETLPQRESKTSRKRRRRMEQEQREREAEEEKNSEYRSDSEAESTAMDEIS